jgi:outer membrane protein assembly factor BamB
MFARLLRRCRGWSIVVLVATSLAPGLLEAAAAVDGTYRSCVDSARIFAVDALTGHLIEIESCRDTYEFEAPAEVDTGEWRRYQHIFATNGPTGLMLYAVDAGGGLLAWRQEAPGRLLGTPIRIGTSIN